MVINFCSDSTNGVLGPTYRLHAYKMIAIGYIYFCSVAAISSTNMYIEEKGHEPTPGFRNEMPEKD